LLKAVVWKELLELSRDRRTLAAVVLMPLLGLPGLAFLTGVLYHEQVARVGVYYEDPQARGVAEWIAGAVKQRAASQGLRVNVSIVEGEPTLGCCDVIVFLPRGFTENLSSLTGRAVVYLAKLIASQAADAAYSAAQGVISDLSRSASERRVAILAEKAGVSVEPDVVLNPISVRELTYKPSGAPATREEVLAAETARMLEFALIFVVNPAVVYVTDAIVGERERRTLEALLVTPLGVRDVVTGKMIASTVIGFIAAMADSVGVLVFFYLIGGLPAVPLELLGLHALVSALLVMMTSAMIAPLAARSPSVRSAQASGMTLLALATAIYFAALFTDLSRLPRVFEALLLAIPFTHAALAIQAYALSSAPRMVAHLLVMIVVAAVGVLAAVKIVDTEKLVMMRG
jgi:ABC-2 type transport system permease protein